MMNFNNQIPGFKMDIPAGAALFPDGTKEGTITATSYHPQFVPAKLPDGRLPLIYVQLEPDGLSFTEPVPVQFGIEPEWGFTVGDEFSFAAYTSEGKYEFIGNGKVEKDDQGNLFIRTDPEENRGQSFSF